MVVEAVRSLLARTEHQDVEVVVVHDAPRRPRCSSELREFAGDRLVLVPFAKPFNFSREDEPRGLHATGDRLVLLNDDVEVISERWLEHLVAPLDEPDVGHDRGQALLRRHTVQHAGHAYAGGHYRHPFRIWTRAEASARSASS